ncbi:2-aminoethylphosphonate--pyruvate aminotransferase [Oceanicola sp. 22II-s10i]|uniref:2-aminoethylphosphonate--pyruvate transaminase n=1 Tax=Oceanicola sp. 22II-s10i TaxID=1317116 RepID=UPI000B5253AC|nr:2-aminoethylphosphonate--pyruvate transaminase [Oceanicola sp. 22II-s10i]OWU83984.1 2-aminoethylphosphonate--pyruvate aminotransferase [Oceanicola sp. 22II-s10i]
MSAYLFTPGPLTTSDAVRQAMTTDWGSRDKRFIALTSEVRTRLEALVNAGDSHAAVLMQGSGTFAVEAAIATLVGPEDRLLVVINGEYGKRIRTIAARMGKSVETLEFGETEAVDPARLATHLAANPGITMVAVVHLETTTGLLNPLPEIAATVADAGALLLLDAMASFGAYDIDVAALPCAAVIASSNKGLHGTPGIGFVIADRALLAARAGVSPSLSLDLQDQLRGFEANGQWRFTPPTHVLAALHCALEEHAAEGGCAGRLTTYQANAARVTKGLEALGYRATLPEALRSAVILTFDSPEGGWFDFTRLYDALAERGCCIYPGKLTQTETFRVGCIGALPPQAFDALLSGFAEVTQQMRQRDLAGVK